MKILVINTGSSSIKYVLFEMKGRRVLTKGLVERIGDKSSQISYSINEEKVAIEKVIKDHVAGLQTIVDLLTDPSNGILKNANEIEAVGHRVVHGGESYSRAIVIDEAVKAKIKELIPLAPLHNPPNLEGIEVAQKFFPGAMQIAVFDTAFHQTMSPESYRYPLPNHLYEKEKIRAYGMHGTSHAYVTKQALEMLDKPKENTAIITIHLGNGCSMSAVKGGKCVDTSMGLSPLAGLMMGTRTGDIDPTIPFYLGTKLGMSFEEIDKMLNKDSGLKGIAGSNDMRDVIAMREKGDPNAALAIDMYTQRIKKYIGAYTAEMGALDAIVFTAGIGENSDVLRSLVCENMQVIGIEIDPSKNKIRSGTNREIQKEGGNVKVLIIPTNEELEIALQAEHLYNESN